MELVLFALPAVLWPLLGWGISRGLRLRGRRATYPLHALATIAGGIFIFAVVRARLADGWDVLGWAVLALIAGSALITTAATAGVMHWRARRQRRDG